MMIKLLNLPPDLYGATVKTVEPDGDFFTIVINENLSHEKQKETYRHEQAHIENDDFNCSCNVSVLEQIRHK